MVDSTISWIVDSVATNHIFNLLQGFRQSRILEKGEHGLRLGNGTKVWAEAVGDVHLSCEDGRKLILADVLYVPELKRSLISVTGGYAFCNRFK